MHQQPTANARFKQGFGTAFSLSLMLATAGHLAVLVLTPEFAVALPDDDDHPPLQVGTTAPPLPPPPAPVQPPAAPLVGVVDVDPGLTIPPTVPHGDWDAIDPPRADPGGEAARAPVFTPYDVAPRLTNPREVQRVLERQYPPLLRDAGIGGVVRVWFHIDETGAVRATQVKESSGYDAFDRAALAVGRMMRFDPARNRDRAVPVWVALDIRFDVK